MTGQQLTAAFCGMFIGSSIVVTLQFAYTAIRYGDLTWEWIYPAVLWTIAGVLALVTWA